MKRYTQLKESIAHIDNCDFMLVKYIASNHGYEVVATYEHDGNNFHLTHIDGNDPALAKMGVKKGKQVLTKQEVEKLANTIDDDEMLSNKYSIEFVFIPED